MGVSTISDKAFEQVSNWKIAGIGIGLALSIAAVVGYLYSSYIQNKVNKLTIMELNSKGFNDNTIIDDALNEF